MLKPIRLALIVFTFFALLLTAYSLIVSSAFSLDILEPAIVSSLWGMLLLASSELFQQLPEPVLPTDSFLRRLVSHGKLFLFSLLAIIIIFVTVLLLWLSLRLLLI